ncbi:9971_t:CDS:2 [Funneliformis geosporum]|uniref:9971_t:CDS:1 n=1 Tax=Funneliformis geosporum TaxID=1117311 RepID=A0A9W4T0X7_9GLOM|nr:9971_t:CDS:2 [Funneliformis geosporum]
MTTKLSRWLKKNLKGNIRNNLDATIENLLRLDPPINRKSVISEQKKALLSSIKVLLKNNKEKEYELLKMWLNSEERKKEIGRTLKIIDKKHQATFKRAKFFSSVVQHAIGSLTDYEFEKETQKRNPSSPRIFPPTSPIKANPAHTPTSQPPPSPSPKEDRKEKGQGASSLEIPQHFSFSPSEQGAYAEPIIQYVDKAFFRYIKKHQKYIPCSTVESFAARYYKLNPTDLFKSFKNEARNHLAHGITQSKGRWNDERLQRLSALALEVVVCLGDKKAFEQLKEVKQKLESELMERRTRVMKRKRKEHEEDENVRKKSPKDIDLRNLLDFSLYMVSKLESDDEKELKRMVQLAVDIDNAFVNIWRGLESQENEYEKVEKFVILMNFRFDMHLKVKKGDTTS